VLNTVRVWCDPFNARETTIVAFEVMTGHKSRPECAGLDSQWRYRRMRKKAFFEVCCAYLWCHCDVRDFGGKPVFLRSQRISDFCSKSRGMETKHGGNKVSTKMSVMPPVTVNRFPTPGLIFFSPIVRFLATSTTHHFTSNDSWQMIISWHVSRYFLMCSGIFSKSVTNCSLVIRWFQARIYH